MSMYRWLIIGVAFMLPISAADLKQSSHLNEVENLVMELVITHAIENPSDLKDFFGVNTYINRYLNSQWLSKVEAWDDKREDHLTNWVNAQSDNGATVVYSKDGFHAALSTPTIHPCETFENPTDETFSLLKDCAQNTNSSVRCFVSAFVNQKNKIDYKKYLYKQTNAGRLGCKNTIAWIDQLDETSENYSSGICYDFKAGTFSPVKIFVQCNKQNINIAWFKKHAPDLFRKMLGYATLFEKINDTIYLDLAKIKSQQVVNALECYFKSEIPKNCSIVIHNLIHLKETILVSDILHKIESFANQYTYTPLRKKINVSGYGDFVYSLIWDTFSFSVNGTTICNYKNSKPVLNPFTQERFEHFCNNWKAKPGVSSEHLDQLRQFFKACTTVMIQKKYILRYDSLNHAVRVLKLHKDTDNVVTVTDYGDTKVPTDINIKTLHVKKDGTLTYKTSGKST